MVGRVQTLAGQATGLAQRSFNSALCKFGMHQITQNGQADVSRIMGRLAFYGPASCEVFGGLACRVYDNRASTRRPRTHQTCQSP